MNDQTFDQFPENLWITAVPVATVWTLPEKVRDLDKDGIGSPADIDRWLNAMDYNAKLSLCNENRVQTQLLYGEQVLVTGLQQGWASVLIPSQATNKNELGYPGWVPSNQLKQVKKKEWISARPVVVIMDKAWLEEDDGERFLKLSYLTSLPATGKMGTRIQVKTPHGTKWIDECAVRVLRSEAELAGGSGQDIVRSGEAFLGLEYLWGGMSSFGYDCSGLAYAIHKANGYVIARDALEQSQGGRNVALDKILPGDLLFFAYEEGRGKLHHVGIYYGEGKLLHSPKTGKQVEIITLAGTVYEKELCTARRYWQEKETGDER